MEHVPQYNHSFIDKTCLLVFLKEKNITNTAKGEWFALVPTDNSSSQ